MPRNIRSPLNLFALFTAIGLLLFGYKYLDFAARSLKIPAGIPLIEELTGAWCAGLLFPLIAIFARRFPLDRPGWLGRLPAHCASVIVFSAVHTSLQWGMRLALTPMFGLGPYDYGNMPVRYLMEFWQDVIIYAVMIGFVYLSDRRLRAAQLEAKLSEARLHNLRLQLQPHFLFNVLNTVSSLMYRNPQAADRMIVSLAELMRLTLSQSPAQEVRLQEEIEFLNRYLDLMRPRFEDNLQVNVNVEPGTERALVPQLILQPLVENAIRHGVDPETAIVQVSVAATREGETLRLRVRDRGPGAAHLPLRKGVGLTNTIDRLANLYGGLHTIEFGNCADGGFAVSVGVPFRV